MTNAPEPLHGQVEDGPNAARPIGPVGLEAVEVVPSDEKPPRLAHGSLVERRMNVPAISKLKRAGDRPVVDHVAVPLRFRVERGVKSLGLFLGIEDTNVARHERVERPHECRRSMARDGEEVDDLAERMNPRIRTTAGGCDCLSARQLAERRFEDLLNGPQARLALPTVKVSAIVAEGELDVPHRGIRCSATGGRLSSAPAQARVVSRRSGRRWWLRPCAGYHSRTRRAGH